MKVRCKVCGEWFEKENLYCDHCAAKYGAERSRYDVDLFEDQRSFSKEDREKMNKKKKTPNFDTMRDLRPPKTEDHGNRPKKKSFSNTIRGVIFFFIFLNIIINVVADMDFDDFINELIGGNDTSVVYEDEAVEIVESTEKKSFPKNTVQNYGGDVSLVHQEPLGIYEGYLSTDTYLNFDTKEMRFDLEDENYSGSYELPIFITITEIPDDAEYYMDIWDQNTLKTLGTYVINSSYFTSETRGEFDGNPSQYFYNEEDYIELDAVYDEYFMSGRLALPYTIDNEVNYFDFVVSKVNDDSSALIANSYLENEHLETFSSDDEQISVDFYTYGVPQGYPHSSMYYDGILAISDGDEGYPPIPFNISDNGEIYADMSYMNTGALTIKDKDFSEYVYYDDVDTQFYRYYPISDEDPVYDIKFIGTIYSEEDSTIIEGSYSIYNRNDGENEIYKTFTIEYLK